MESELEECKNELCQLESEAKKLKNDFRLKVPSLDPSKNEEPDVNPIVAYSTISSEQLEIRRLKEALFALQEDRIKSTQDLIKWKEKSIKARGGLNALEDIIEDRQYSIKSTLQCVATTHEIAFTELISLDAYRDDSDDDVDCSWDDKRVSNYNPLTPT